MTYRYSSFSKALNVTADFLLLNFALYCCFVWEHPDQFGMNVTENYHVGFFILNLTWFYCSSLNKLYEDIFKRDAIPTIRITLQSLFLMTIISLIQTAVLPYTHLPVKLLMAFLIIFSVLLISWKIVFLLARRPRRWALVRFKKIVIVGAGSQGIDLYNYLTTNKQMGYEVVGFFDDNIPVILNGNPILGKIDECMEYVEAHGIDEVYCALPDIAKDKITMLMEESDRRLIRIKLIPDVKDYFKSNFMVELYGHMPVLIPRREPLEDKANELVKRGFDIAFSLLVVVFLLSWLVPLMAIIIKMESKGPVFFRQLRSGKDNRPFYCLKFRSMTVNQDSDLKQAVKGDNRITHVGAFIRKTSIDELPQFINVLMGDMSVVGPRPHMLKHTEDYSQIVNKYMVRHFLIPGITGWAQVNGLRGETKETAFMEKRVEADIWYLENWSFLLDLKIVVLTVWQSIRGNNNAF